MDDPQDETANRRRKNSDPAVSLATFTSVANLTTRVAVLDRDIDSIKNDILVSKQESKQDRAMLHQKVDSQRERLDKVEGRLDSLHDILKWILGVATSTFVLVLAGLIMFFIQHAK